MKEKTDDLIFIIFCRRTSINNRQIVPNCRQCKAWKPMNTVGPCIYLNKGPSHPLCSFAFFPPISNYTKPHIWITPTLLYPFETLKFAYFPWAVHWNNFSCKASIWYPEKYYFKKFKIVMNTIIPRKLKILSYKQVYLENWRNYHRRLVVNHPFPCTI